MDDDDDSGNGSLFDPEEGRRRRDEGMARAHEHNPEECTAAGKWAVVGCCQAAGVGGTVTSDDVWQYLHDNEMAVSPEKRALGQIMKAAAKAGWLEITDRTEPSKRPERHRGTVRVWIVRRVE